ncbi:olfactory receptor 52D1-like [Spea bombifrons]|uniref:olfactory receptor 52D1-like n=1 Tax=Spea bombifrons TaxID=233779 RepID=UPI00234BE037|nr:olfactory receptor 52D1-like [Spea bombifrons]
MTSVRYLYSVIVLVGFMMIVLYNGAVISVVAMHKSLQEPMYIFVSALCFNELYGSTAFFPNLFVNLVTNSETISYVGCLTQAFCISTYVGCEMTILTVMAFDRYVCICNPLRYHTILSLSTVYKLIVASWLYPIILIVILVTMTVRLPLCGTVILKIYCDNWTIVRLSCIDTTANNIYGLFVTVALVVLLPALIFVSYVEILKVCLKSPAQTRIKALQTCTPHLISITVFVVDVLFEILLYRFAPTNVPSQIRVVMSIQLLVVPPLLNPLMYGLKTKEIKSKLAQLVQRELCTDIKAQTGFTVS